VVEKLRRQYKLKGHRSRSCKLSSCKLLNWQS